MKVLPIDVRTHEELEADFLELFRKHKIPWKQENCVRAFRVSHRVMFTVQLVHFASGSMTLRFGSTSKLYLSYSALEDKITIGVPGMDSETQWLLAGQYYVIAEALLATLAEEWL